MSFDIPAEFIHPIYRCTGETSEQRGSEENQCRPVVAFRRVICTVRRLRSGL